MVGLSEVVLRGRVLDVRDVEYGQFPILEMTVEPTEILKGEPLLTADGEVVVQFLRGAEASQLRAILPDHENLWFLNLDEDYHSYASSDYNQVSILRNVDGEVRVIRPDFIARAYSRDHYPVPLEGTSFDELMDKVRELTSTDPTDMALAITQPGIRSEPSALFAC